MTLILLIALAAVVLATWPVISATHTVGRADLTGAFEEYSLDEGLYIAQDVAPVVGVNKKGGNFPVITRESLTSLENSVKKGYGAAYPRMTFATEDKSYGCEVHGVEMPLDDDQVKELVEDFGFEPDEAAGSIIYHQLRRQLELRVAAILFDPNTNFTGGKGNYTDVSGTAPWTTTTSSILATIAAAQDAVEARTGMRPTDMLINAVNLTRLLQNTTITGAIATSKDKTVREIGNLMAPLLGLERIHVGKAVYNATPGLGTFSGSRMWSNLYALVFVNTPGSTVIGPRVACTPLWKRSTPQLVVLSEYREDETDSTVMRAKSATDELLCDEYFGQLVKVAAA